VFGLIDGGSEVPVDGSVGFGFGAVPDVLPMLNVLATPATASVTAVAVVGACVAVDVDVVPAVNKLSAAKAWL
jgi:hypothetical protein